MDMAPQSTWKLADRKSSILKHHAAKFYLLSFIVLLSCPERASGQYAYIIGRNITVIDTKWNVAVSTIALDFLASDIVVSPTAAKAYLYDGGHDANYAFVEMNLATTSIVRRWHLKGWVAAMTVTPDGKRVYAAAGGRISIFDTERNNLSFEEIPNLDAEFLAVSPDGRRLYLVGDGWPNSKVTVVSTENYSVVATIGVGKSAAGITVASDGRKAYVANGDDDTISVVDIVSDTISATIPVGAGPRGVALTPDDKKLYVTCSPRLPAERPGADFPDSEVAVIDTARGIVSANINFTDNRPVGVMVTPDGREVYVVNENRGTVSVINVSSDEVIATIRVGDQPRSITNFIGPGPRR
jgi:YVTN family beta-propeller protein